MMRRCGCTLGLAVFMATAHWGPGVRAQAVDTDPFDRASVRTSVVLGWGEAYLNDYFILGLGAGYFVADGLELGLDVEGWLGSDPSNPPLQVHPTGPLRLPERGEGAPLSRGILPAYQRQFAAGP